MRVIALRFALLTVAALSMLAAFGALAADVQPAALRVGVAAVIALLAPMFLAQPHALQSRAPWASMLGRSIAQAGLAAVLMVALGRGRQTLPPVLEVCAMLLPMLLLSQGLVWLLQRLWLGLDDDPKSARWGAGIGASALLGLLGSALLWLGPAAERASQRFAGAIDALLAASPLTHLAVASGLDLLRQPWLYRNSNLSSLPADYPAPARLAAVYGVACIVMLAAAFVLGRHARPGSSNPLTEKRP